MEFLGKLSETIVGDGNECILAVNSKISEFCKLKYFSNNAKVISKVDWCIKNYSSKKKNFGRISWREFFTIFERFQPPKFSYNRAVNSVNQVYQFLEFIFFQEKPDVIISEMPAGLFHEVAFYFCKKNNIPYVGIINSRLTNRVDIYDLETRCSKYKETFDKLKFDDLDAKEKTFSKNFTDKFLSHKELPPYMGIAKTSFSQLGLISHFIARVKNLATPSIKYFLSRPKYRFYDYESEAILRAQMNAPFIAERKKIRAGWQKKFFKKITDGKFFFFPLHFQPEASTLVQATYYSDQLNTIRNTAFSLPFPYKLFVKEHSVAVGTRPSSFYKNLNKIPNVVLVSSDENTEELIRESAGVITLTSTVGLEAALSGKPVYVLGDVFYDYHPYCQKAVNFNDLRERIMNDLFEKKYMPSLDEINARFIISYFRNTIEGSMTAPALLNDKNDYGKICRDIKRLFLKKNGE